MGHEDEAEITIVISSEAMAWHGL